jgi:hypothetical protein
MTVCVHIRGNGVVLQVPRDRANTVGKGLISWVNHLELNYNMTLVISRGRGRGVERGQMPPLTL